MRTFRMLAVAAGLAAFAVACGGGGDSADSAAPADSAAAQRTAAAQIHAGMTQDDVRNKLGEPRTRVTMDGGLERWTYYSYDTQGQIAAKTLIIFGNDGKVVEVNNL